MASKSYGRTRKKPGRYNVGDCENVKIKTVLNDMILVILDFALT